MIGAGSARTGDAPVRARDRDAARGPGADPLLLSAVLALTATGAVMVYSASAVTADARLHDQFYYLKRQLVAAAAGMALLVAALKLGPKRLERLALPVLFATIAGLVLVLIPGIGRMAGGARRWIDLGVISFQPAEAAKVALVLYLARTMARKRDKVRVFTVGVLGPLLVAGALMALVLAERDLGTCVILGAVLFTVLFAAGAKPGHLGAVVLSAAPILYWLVAGTPYRLARFKTFLDPWSHREGAGFQLVESLLGIGNGGWLGQGLGEGKGKLFYLPAAHTDFIAAVIAEEVGLVGVAVLLGLYAVVVWRGLRAALGAADAFGCYAALGVTTLLASQALVNFSVVFGLLPTKGLTLPFVSYGGSSLMTLLGATGILLAVSASPGGFLKRTQGGQRVVADAAAGGAA